MARVGLPSSGFFRSMRDQEQCRSRGNDDCRGGQIRRTSFRGGVSGTTVRSLPLSPASFSFDRLETTSPNQIDGFFVHCLGFLPCRAAAPETVELSGMDHGLEQDRGTISATAMIEAEKCRADRHLADRRPGDAPWIGTRAAMGVAPFLEFHGPDQCTLDGHGQVTDKLVVAEAATRALSQLVDLRIEIDALDPWKVQDMVVMLAHGLLAWFEQTGPAEPGRVGFMSDDMSVASMPSVVRRHAIRTGGACWARPRAEGPTCARGEGKWGPVVASSVGHADMRTDAPIRTR